MADAPKADVTPVKTPPRRNAKKWLWGGLLMLFLLGLPIAAVVVAVQTEVGARTVWGIATRLMPQRLAGEVTDGTLRHGLTLRDVVYQDDARQIRIDRVDARWRLTLSPLKLTVFRLALGNVQATLLPTPPEPLILPDSLQLPLALDLRQATLEQLTVSQNGAQFAFGDIALQASSDQVNHRLVLEHADTPLGRAALQLRLNGTQPFRLNGTASLGAKTAENSYDLNARFFGSLAQMKVVVEVAGKQVAGTADIVATPFAAIPFTQARIAISDLNLAAFNPGAPRTDLSIYADLAPAANQAGIADLSGLQVLGPVSIVNKTAGTLDQGLLPLVSVSTAARLDADSQQLSDLVIRLADGATLTGKAQNRSPLDGTLDLQVTGLNLAAIHGALQPTRLNGPLAVAFNDKTQHAYLDLADKSIALKADADINAASIALNSATLQSGAAKLVVSGSLARDAQAAYAIEGKLTRFDPGLFIDTMKLGKAGADVDTASKSLHANINSNFTVTGRLQPQLVAKAKFDIYDSSYDSLPLRGGGTVQVAGQRVLQSDAELSIAGNDFRIRGAFGAPRDKLYLNVDAPALDRLGFGLSGSLKLDGDFAGSLEKPRVNAMFTAKKLRFGTHRLASATGEVHALGLPAENSDAKLKIDVDAQGYRSDLAQLDTLTAKVAGSYRRHDIQLDVNGQVRGNKLDLTLAAQGGLTQTAAGMSWRGMLQQLDNRSLPRIHLANAVSLQLAPQQITLGKASIDIAKARLALDGLAYRAGAIRSAGTLTGVDVAHLLELRRQFTGEQTPVKTDLVLDARWDFDIARQGKGFVQIDRQRGDISSDGPAGDIRLGLDKLLLRAELAGTDVAIRAEADADRIGNVQANGIIGLDTAGPMLAITPQSPLEGRIVANIPQLRKAGVLAGPRISLDGRIVADLELDGTVGDPVLSGQINGDDLALTLYDQGVRLRDGIARITLRDDVLVMQKVEFRGGKGALRITGSIPLDSRHPDLSASIVAEKLQLLADPSAQLTLSGKAGIASTGDHLAVNGKFTVDRAMFSLPKTPAPELGDDVVIVRKGDNTAGAVNDSAANVENSKQQALAEKPASPYSPVVDLDIDLGNNFRFEGQGAELRLEGVVNITSRPQQQPKAQGTVTVAEGIFEAFGTKLDIERGIINFQGPMDNPNINILAMRRNQEVAAGVQITGTAERPRVTLVSEPDLPQEQKLSWLVFGRASGGNESGQAQAAAQGAALALLNELTGNRIAQNVGLDEISLGTSASGEQLLSLGKTISDKLSLGYRQGLTGLDSAVELTYLLSQNWSVVTRGGRILGINIFYSNRFDEVFGNPEPERAREQ